MRIQSPSLFVKLSTFVVGWEMVSYSEPLSQQEDNLLHSEVPPCLHVSVGNYKNHLEVKIPNLQALLLSVCIIRQVWGKLQYSSSSMSSEEDFTILSSEYEDYEKRGKWSVSTLTWDHRVFGSFLRLVISKGSTRYIITLYISHKTEEPLFDLTVIWIQTKGVFIRTVCPCSGYRKEVLTFYLLTHKRGMLSLRKHFI